MDTKTENLVDRLVEYMDEIEVVDTHEHLLDESERLKYRVDFAVMFAHYTSSDFISAGMRPEDYERFGSGDIDIEEKWRLFEPYYKKIKNGSYARAARISMKKFYGMDDLNSLDDARQLTERIKEANKPGLYKKVLKDTCKLSNILVFSNPGPIRKDDIFERVDFVTGAAEVPSLHALNGMFKVVGGSSPTLAGYVDLLRDYIKRRKDSGLKGLKIHCAYNRDLHFEDTATADAEKIYMRIFNETLGMRQYVLGYEETRPFQNYMVQKIAEIAGETDLPLVFHVGLQATRSRIEYSRPSNLWNLLNRYSKTKFVLLHAGIPWMEEAGILAKYFDNVYVDMAWTHIISPELSVKALKTWVDMVPQNKIFGFGGDYSVVEKVYGHLQMAKQDIARSLAAKVEDCSMSEQEARTWAKAILYDNPREVYKL